MTAKCNKNFFDVPTINNSYWAGYLAGDGSILDKGKIELACQTSDEEILKAFLKATEAENNILHRTFDTRGTICHRSRLAFCGRYDWQSNLEKYWNIGKRKSLTLKPPNITDKKQIYAYIVGLTDADGAVFHWYPGPQYRRRQTVLCMSWTNTEEILVWIREQLIKLCPNLSWKDKITPKKGCWHYLITAKKARLVHQELLKVVNLPYRLSRKWDIEYNIKYK